MKKLLVIVNSPVERLTDLVGLKNLENIRLLLFFMGKLKVSALLLFKASNCKRDKDSLVLP